MELRHLRTFVAVAESGTVSTAAARLHIAQPALSRQIMALEEDLGVALFDRVGGRLQLSGAGERLLGDCRGLLNFARDLREQARALGRTDAGLLRVAASPHYIDSVFPEFLARFARRYPDVRVSLMDLIGANVIGMLERGEVHLAQTSPQLLRADHSHIASRELPAVDMMAAWSPALPLPHVREIEIAALRGFPLLQTGTEYVIRRMFDAACRLAGFEPDNVLESRAPHALLAMAEAGHGIAVIPSALSLSRYRLNIARITYRRKAVSAPLALLYDRRRPQPAYALAFADMLASYVRGIWPITRPRGHKR